MKFRALEAALNTVWLMEPAALETLLTIAAREHEVSPEALEAYKAKTLANAEQATVRDGVAIISANGPMIKRGNFFSAMSGATSYDVLARDLTAARDNPKVKAAILNLDSPGGQADGAGELASMIKAFAAQKPIVAYVNGQACSATYWLASACPEIVIDPIAILGSIGARFALKKTDEAKGTTTFEFVSSQSPLKNADPASPEGAAQYQSAVDAMAQVFVEAVAANRGVAIETVLSDFGKGGIFVGQDAINAGLADRIGTFEGVLAELSAGRRGVRKGKGAKMSEETFTRAEMAAEIAKAVADAQAEANARNVAVTALVSGFGLDNATLTAALAGGKSVADIAVELAPKAAEARTAALAAAKAEGKAEAVSANKGKTLAALKSDEASASAAAPAVEEPDGEETAEAVAARINAA